MIENPFAFGGYIPAKYFCDREKESKELILLVTNGNNVVLFSPRRMGKTGLVLHCFDEEVIKRNYITFYIDILQTTSLRELIFLLGKEIFRVLAPRGLKFLTGFLQTVKSLTGKIGFDPVSGLPSFNLNLGDISNPELTLEEIFHYLEGADRRCIIAIDEFQQITRYSEKNVEAVLRSHIQLSTNVNFIFSGSQRHILKEIFLSAARPFYNSAAFMHLGVIPREIYVDFIIRKFKEKDKSISKHTAEGIYDRFEGHTFYVQRMCNVAFSYTNVGKECDRKVVDFALDYLLNSYDTLFRSELSSLTERQKELLYAVASEGKAKEITSVGFIQKYSLQSASSVQSNARSLVEKDILTKDENTYIVSDRFFGLWLQRMLTGR